MIDTAEGKTATNGRNVISHIGTTQYYKKLGGYVMSSIIRSQNIKWRDEDICFTVYNFDTDELFQTSHIGIDILETCKNFISIENCAERVMEKNNITEEKKEKIIRFIHLLINKQLIIYN